MFKLEKVFQNDDYIFINLYIFINSLFIFFSIYTYSILENNSLFYFFNYDIFKQSFSYEFSFLITFIFFVSQFIFPFKKRYNHSYLYFFKTTFIYFLNSYILSFFIILYFIQDFFFTIKFFYIFILCLIFLIFNKFLFNQIYEYLIHTNIIQRNILLVGHPNFILNIINDQRNKINIFKCCLTNLEDEDELKKFKQEIKIPVFTFKDDARIILEYHAIGQIWILDNGDQNILYKYLNKVLDFPIDILQINISKKLPYNQNLINNIYEYKEYSISKFYGVKFFIKILLDKVLSLIFLILTLPIITIFSILIYLEDGFPIFFKQERTGWDGRRFIVYKMRSLNYKIGVNFQHDQVIQSDPRLLKTGRFIRKFSIDELPQFLNVLKGDMSIVGPRPHPIQMDIYFNKINNYMTRYKTLPGITGWAQVNGSRGATPTEKSIKKRMDYDLWYLNNWSLVLDIYIILKTFYAIIKYKG